MFVCVLASKNCFKYLVKIGIFHKPVHDCPQSAQFGDWTRPPTGVGAMAHHGLLLELSKSVHVVNVTSLYLNGNTQSSPSSVWHPSGATIGGGTRMLSYYIGCFKKTQVYFV